MLNLVDSAGDLARRVDAGTAGVVRLGFTAVSAISVLGPLLRRLTAALPDVEVLLSERVTNAQVDGIRRAELDIGLARPPFDTGFLASQVVLREPLIAVVPVDHPLASGSPAADARRTSRGSRSSATTRSSRATSTSCRSRFLANAHPRVEQRVHQVLTAMLLVAAGRGLAVAPASAASLHVEGVVLKDLVHGGGDTQLDADPERPVELHAIWPRAAVTPVVRRVLDVIGEVAAER